MPLRRGLRHDRGGAPDGLQPAAARRAPARHRRRRDRHRDRDPRRRLERARRSATIGEVVRARARRRRRLPLEPRGERRVLPRRLVPHRRLRARSTPTATCTSPGRIKELINRGGEKISPHEVEDALLKHPAVTEAVAFSLPDAKYGETVGAVVVLTGEADEDGAAAPLPASCSPSSRCRRGSSRWTRSRRAPTGKIQRRTMAERIGAG